MYNGSIKKRILICLTVMGLSPLLVMALESQYVGKKALIESEKGHLGYALKSRLAWLNAWLYHTKKEFYYAGLSDCAQGRCTGENKSKGLLPVCSKLLTVERGHATYSSLATYDDNWGIIVVSSDTADKGPDSPADHIKKLLERADGFVAAPDYIYENGRVLVPVGHPAFNMENKRIAYVVGNLDLTKSITKIFGNTSDLGETGKVFLISKDGRYLWHPDHDPRMIGTKAEIPQEILRQPFNQIKRYKNKAGEKMIGIAGKVEQGMDWLMVVEVKEAEAFRWLTKGLFYGAFTGIATLLALSVYALRSSKKLSQPLMELARVARNISKGQRQERVPRFDDHEPREVGEAFNQMLDQLEVNQRALAHAASLAAVGELSSSIVHEMRNPLSSIKMNLKAVAEKVKDEPDYAEMAELTLQQSKRLEAMLADLMQYGKPLELVREDTDFQDLANTAINTLVSQAAAKNIAIRLVNNLGNKTLFVDRERMIQAITNLLANAIVWSPSESELVLEADLEINGKEIVISVSDKGKGIKEKLLNKIFQPFFTTREEGTGLGLANVRKIIEYHGGTVFAKNNPNGGSTFTIKLPMGEVKI